MDPDGILETKTTVISAFQTRTASINNWIVVVLVMYTTFVEVDALYAAVVYGLSVWFGILYYVFRNTVAAAGTWEIDSRRRLFENVQNDLLNRAVLQSTDAVVHSRNR